MTIPYRTRRHLSRLATLLLVLLLCAGVVWFFWMIWLGRFVVYTAEGAIFDFSRSSDQITGQPALPPEPPEPIAIYYNDGSDAIAGQQELGPISGYYIETADLKGDISHLRAQIKSLPDNTPIMIELKDIFGNFYYSTSLAKAPKDSETDIAGVDALISDLVKSRRYLIASVPAFRDRAFGLENTNYGVASSEGAYLYMDGEGCYWLNPESSGTLSRIGQIVNELKGLGFHEVVFTDFSFPDSTAIDFDGSRWDVIAQAAEYCMKSFSGDNFAVSFSVTDPDFPLPEGRGRLYLSNLSPNQIKRTVESLTLPDPLVNLVLLTTLTDTRFDDYSVMRSILMVE